MNKVNWSYTFIDKNLQNYLSYNEFYELSLASKYLRSRLVTRVFNNLNFELFIRRNDFKSWISKEPVNQKELKDESYVVAYENAIDFDVNPKSIVFFKNPFRKLKLSYRTDKDIFSTKLQAYKDKITSICLIGMRDYYHCFYAFPDLFSNLQSLKLIESALPMNLVQCLFDNLKYIASITLSNCEFYQSRVRHINLKFPESIQNLTVNNCSMRYIENDTDPIPFTSGRIMAFNSKELSLPSQYLPNLVSFKIYGFLQYDQSLVNFLSSNPQIKYLCLDEQSLGINIEELLISKHSLTHLSILKSVSQPIELNVEALSRLKTLNSLEIYLPNQTTYFNLLNINLSNIHTLIVNIDFMEYSEDYTKEFVRNQLLTILKKFINIKVLKVNFNWYSIYDRKYMVNDLKNLKEFEEFSIIFNSIQNLNINRLKVIKIRVFNGDRSMYGKMDLKLSKNWEFKEYESSVICFSTI